MLALVMVWLAMQLFFLVRFGIVTNGEATKYIFEANHFLETGQYSSNNFLFYSVQIMLIAFCMKIHIGYWFIVFIQILLNGLSVICFYKIIQGLTERKWLSIVGTFYFVGLYYYHLYNTYLYTESLFFSFSVIYTYVLFSLKRLNTLSIAKIIFSLALLYFTRPTGIFFLPATFLFIVLKFFPKRALRIFAIGGVAGALLFFLLLNYSLGSGGEFDFLLPYIDEVIICGVPTSAIPHKFIIPVEMNSVQGLFYFITHYTDLFFKLSWRRLSAFFGVSRNFYSLFHNIYISAYFYIVYILIIINIRYLFQRMRAQAWFLLTNILLMTVTVMLSCDEWSNRFILSIFPFFPLLATVALENRKRYKPGFCSSFFG